jgi:hypothetical protein
MTLMGKGDVKVYMQPLIVFKDPDAFEQIEQGFDVCDEIQYWLVLDHTVRAVRDC